MSKIIDIRTEQARKLSREIEVGLRRGDGTVVVSAGDVNDVELWRRGARMAGRRLGVPIQTRIGDGIVEAQLLTPVTRAQDRDAAERVAALIFGSRRTSRRPEPS